jgi:hydroxylysine kinase
MLLEARVAQPITETEASSLARELYGIEANAKSLPGEYDDNFHLIARDQQQFVLKVMHPARDVSFVDMQARALQHLAEKLPQQQLSRVIKNTDGQLFKRESPVAGIARQCRPFVRAN